MKRWMWFVVAAAAAGGLTVAIVLRPGPPPSEQMAMISDALKAMLPEDQKLAQKELQSARAALAKLRPRKKYIVIDTHANVITLRTADSVLVRSACSTGSGGELVDTTSGRRWVFNTPRGVFKVNSKLVDPWWRKPDWAFIEENEPIPEDPGERYDDEMLGEYALGFGDHYYIHGTIYSRLLGVSVTHGCVRVGSEALKKIYDAAPMGTPVYIF